ncbi:MAG TPA: hypothetical protein VNO32_23815, partial [Candidatus Acidoferrum sp.]|nr:hypothetical protein [Candidatus Acidoferrum sp.]
MQFIEATGLHRKSGAAQWRDLCVDALSWKCFSTERTWISYFAAVARTTGAVFRKGNRMKLINATAL